MVLRRLVIQTGAIVWASRTAATANGLAKYTVTECLDEYARKLKWNKNGDTIIDLGCGDGSVTCLLKKYLPKNIGKFVACDINEKMLKFASETHGDENITFRLQDVEGVLPDDMKCSFTHVFSFFLFHWIRQQETAFQNVYDLLLDGGECFLLFFGYMPFYHIYDILGRGSKWGDKWLKNASDDFISIYYNMKPEKWITQMLHSIGFVNINVECKKMRYVFKDVVELQHLLGAVEPYSMPEDVFEEFFKDFLTAGHDIGFIDKSINSVDDVHKEILFNYSLLVVHANKP